MYFLIRLRPDGGLREIDIKVYKGLRVREIATTEHGVVDARWGLFVSHLLENLANLLLAEFLVADEEGEEAAHRTTEDVVASFGDKRLDILLARQYWLVDVGFTYFLESDDALFGQYLHHAEGRGVRGLLVFEFIM